MGQALYRKYRSRSFDEVVGQDHIVKTLQNALNSGRVSHAYLFTGPRGVGKTSVARILAHEVNGLEYKDESIHLDIIEIDAASNRRIDEIRELRERVHIAPTSAKYKVYIIDEVHMLTREAFNALLKTLEEPPTHCIFILATTELHKLPETIISRTQHFNFKLIEKTSASAHLGAMAKDEKIDITPEAIELLAEHGSGSFRDSISLLDQFSGVGGKIDEKRIRELLGLPAEEVVKSLLASIESGDGREALKSLDELKEQGSNFAVVAKMLSSQLRDKLIDGQTEVWRLKLLRRLSSAAASADPQEKLEIDVLEAASANSSFEIVKKSEEPKPHKPTGNPTKADESKPEITEPEPPENKEQSSEIADRVTLETANTNFNMDSWPDIVNKVKTEAASLYTALRLAQPRLEGDKLVLGFQFPLHKNKLNQAKNIELIGRIIEELTGTKLAIICEVDKTIKSKIAKIKPVQPPNVEVKDETPLPNLQTINNIFGTAEMLES